MLQITDDVRIADIKALHTPTDVIDRYALSDATAKSIVDHRRQIGDILHGRDDRLVIVVGPCSIHDPQAAIEYAERLSKAAKQYQDDLLIVMRVYFEKPRTTVGWKGLINDPNLDGSFDINHGLELARELLLKIANLQLPTATEFLDTIIPQYLCDLISWGAIGARTTESQVHRELSSGLSMPIGFKNGTDGRVQIALDAIQAAQKPHHFLSVTKRGQVAIVTTKGNEDCHIVLRGSNEGPNYSPQHIKAVTEQLQKVNLPPYLMVDCSHGNSNKDYRRQPEVAHDLMSQMQKGETAIAAIMIESNLVEGNQKFTDKKSLVYGQSITDACIDWETTTHVLEDFAKAVQARRQEK